MKNSIFIFLLPLLVLWGCNETPKTLSDAEKEAIKNEVKSVFDETMVAANEHDAAGMTAHDWNSPDYLYASNGMLVKGWEAKSNAAQAIHSNPELKSYGVALDKVIMRVISPEAVMVTCEGYFNNFPGEQGPRDIKLALTSLYEKIDGKWVMTVGHESTHEQLF